MPKIEGETGGGRGEDNQVSLVAGGANGAGGFLSLIFITRDAKCRAVEPPTIVLEPVHWPAYLRARLSTTGL